MHCALRMHIAYAAHTEACTFYLDDDGICRRVLRKRAKPLTALLSGANEENGSNADQRSERCLGAQYVASLDPSASGGLIPLPRVGVPMLFAYVGEGGRIALVRTGNVLRFEQHGTPDDRPSQRQTRPSLADEGPDTDAAKPDSGVRACPEIDEDEPIVPDIPIEIAAPIVSDATAEMPVAETAEMPAIAPLALAPLTDDDCDETDAARTQLFRASRPPPSTLRAASGNTPIPERPSWMPSTRVERVSIVHAPPPSSPREIEAAPSTDRDPTPVTPRGRGMLPLRAGRGRG